MQRMCSATARSGHAGGPPEGRQGTLRTGRRPMRQGALRHDQLTPTWRLLGGVWGRSDLAGQHAAAHQVQHHPPPCLPFALQQKKGGEGGGGRWRVERRAGGVDGGLSGRHRGEAARQASHTFGSQPASNLCQWTGANTSTAPTCLPHPPPPTHRERVQRAKRSLRRRPKPPDGRLFKQHSRQPLPTRRVCSARSARGEVRRCCVTGRRSKHRRSPHAVPANAAVNGGMAARPAESPLAVHPPTPRLPPVLRLGSAVRSWQ